MGKYKKMLSCQIVALLRLMLNYQSIRNEIIVVLRHVDIFRSFCAQTVLDEWRDLGGWGIEPATPLFVVECLNHSVTAPFPINKNMLTKNTRKCGDQCFILNSIDCYRSVMSTSVLRWTRIVNVKAHNSGQCHITKDIL